MPGDYAALKSELAAPDLAGLADADAATALAAPVVRHRARGIPRQEIGAYCQRVGLFYGLQLAAGVYGPPALADGSAPSPTVLRVAREALNLIEGRGGTETVWSEHDDTWARYTAVLDVLTAAGLLTSYNADGTVAVDGPTNRAALVALADLTTSRAEAIPGWDLTATAADVTHARSLT